MERGLTLLFVDAPLWTTASGVNPFLSVRSKRSGNTNFIASPQRVCAHECYSDLVCIISVMSLRVSNAFTSIAHNLVSLFFNLRWTCAPKASVMTLFYVVPGRPWDEGSIQYSVLVNRLRCCIVHFAYLSCAANKLFHFSRQSHQRTLAVVFDDDGLVLLDQTELDY